MICPSCSFSNVEAARFCQKCGVSFGAASVRSEGVPRQFAEGKSPVAAALLSLFLPTLAIGQFYNGDFKKGLAIVVASLIAVPLWAAGGLGSILQFGLWVWSVLDAYRVAKRSIPFW